MAHPKRELVNYMFYNHPQKMTDKAYLSILFKQKMGYDMNWENPVTFQEKIQWMKVNYHNPSYPLLVDKYKVKPWVAGLIGDKFIIPTLGAWEKYEDIDFDKLPNEFVLKCNHDSGSVVICHDKRKIDHDWAAERLNSKLKTNYYWWAREWAYKNVKSLIIAEPLLKDENATLGRANDTAIKDYKFFCFKGVPQLMYISDDHGLDPRTDFFDMDFKRVNLQFRDKNSNKEIEKPKHFEKMIELSKVLSKDFPFVRVDFYLVGDRIYFGEMTFYHASGFFPITPEKMNVQLSAMLELPDPIL